MNKIIQNLRSQHQQLLTMLDDGTDLLSIIQFVENEHHSIEEQELFPLIASHPLLKEGGPLCTFFWGMEMDLKPKSGAEDILKNLYTNGFVGQKDTRSFPWLPEHTPLQIPMGEHFLNHELSYAICELSKNPDTPVAQKFLEPLKTEYIKLLRGHIDKEDNCLFILCEKILNATSMSEDNR
ncbi:MAG: hypothetical protein ACKOX6_17230 [Bdellovibrio sp.]